MPPPRLDLHVHSRRSRDGRGTPLQLARQVKAQGLQGFALTDHDTVAGHAEARTAARAQGLLFIPAVEVTTREGHLLAYGVREAPEPGLSVQEAVERIDALGGLAAAAHPLRLRTGMGAARLGVHATAHRLRAAEAANARDGAAAQAATHRLVHGLGLAEIGGSDAHGVVDAGLGWTRFEVPLASVEDALQAIRAGKTRAEAKVVPRRMVWGQRLRMGLDAVAGARGRPSDRRDRNAP